MTSKLLALDVSTKSTGFSFFDIETKTLLRYGNITAKLKGLNAKVYPEKQLLTMKEMSKNICEILNQEKEVPTQIVIEEITGGINRLTQKVLDACHFILLNDLNDLNLIDRVVYFDCTGLEGWRFHLGLRLSDGDKLQNKEAKELNKKIARGIPKIPIIGPKHLACRFVNHHYGMNLDFNADETHGDIADSICMGHAYLHTVQT